MNDGSLGGPEIAFFTGMVFAASAVVSYALRRLVFSRPVQFLMGFLRRRPLPAVREPDPALEARWKARIVELSELIHAADERIAELRRLAPDDSIGRPSIDPGAALPRTRSAKPRLQPLIVQVDDHAGGEADARLVDAVADFGRWRKQAA